MKKNTKPQLQRAKHKHNLKYTFLIVPNSDNKTKSFTLPGLLVKNGAILLLISICVLSVFIYSYIQMKFLYDKKQAELVSLTQINREQQQKIQDLDNYASQIDEKLSYLCQLEDTVKDMVGLEKNEDEESGLEISTQGTNESESNTTVSRSYYLRSEIQEENFDNLEKLDELETTLTLLDESIDYKEEDLSSLKVDVKNRLNYLEAYPNKWPTHGRISSTFGYRTRPYTGFHKGIDIANSSGTSVVAAGKGKVIFAGYKGGYGYCIIIDHGYGFKTLYAHLSSIHVNVGQWVSKSQFIARMGNTGNSTGPHLHFEVQVNNQPQNPYKYLR